MVHFCGALLDSYKGMKTVYRHISPHCYLHIEVKCLKTLLSLLRFNTSSFLVFSFVFVRASIPLNQWCTTSGPRATSGPRRVLVWPAVSNKKNEYFKSRRLVYNGTV